MISVGVTSCQHTAEVVISTVHHISCMDELVAGAFHTKLCLRITQNSHPPAEIENMDYSDESETMVQRPFYIIHTCMFYYNRQDCMRCRVRKSPLDVTKGTKKEIQSSNVFCFFLLFLQRKCCLCFLSKCKMISQKQI